MSGSLNSCKTMTQNNQTTKFVRRLDLPEQFPRTDDDYAMYSLIAETIATYYWCEAFTLRGTKKLRSFCVLGQRGLVEYAAKKIHQVYLRIQIEAARRNETIGWQYGVIISLRDALHARRKTELEDPVYHEQMIASVYRARHNLKTAYRVGHIDARAVFDIDGFDRGKHYPWILDSLLTPIQVMDLSPSEAQQYEAPDAKD